MRIFRTLRDLLDLAVFELDRGGAPEDRDRHLEPRTLLVDLLDRAVEAGERAVGHPDGLADLVGDRRLRPLDALLHLLDDARGLGLADRHRPVAGTEKAGDLRRVLDQVPDL